MVTNTTKHERLAGLAFLGQKAIESYMRIRRMAIAWVGLAVP